MRFILFVLLPIIVIAKSNSSAGNCFRDLILLKNIGTELTLVYVTAGCNVLLLILNITILYAVIGYMKPTISEIRKQTFIIMDYILLSYIPSKLRKVIGCKPQISLDGKPEKGGKKEAETSKASKKSAKSDKD